jgi:hypothetical protein
MPAKVDRTELANSLLSLSEEMLAAYQDDRLEELPGLQAGRERLINAIFANIYPGELGDLLWVHIIERVQFVNDQLVVLVTQKRDRIAEELKAIRSARKADSAYFDYL